MISSIDVNCEKMIVFSSSSRSRISLRMSKIIRVFAECSGRFPSPARDLRLDLAARTEQSSQWDESMVELFGDKLHPIQKQSP